MKHIEPQPTFALISLAVATGAALCAFIALVHARRLITRSKRAMACVIELAPADFGAQNFGPLLERNGLRPHIVRIEGDGESEPVVIASYWWREAGSRAPVILMASTKRYRFETDVYTAPIALAGAAAVAAVIAGLFWF